MSVTKPVEWDETILNRPVKAVAADTGETMFEGIATTAAPFPTFGILTPDGDQHDWDTSLTIPTGDAEVIVGYPADRLMYVDVETPSEYLTEDRDPEYGEVTGYSADPRMLPGPAWVEALDKVNAAMDEAMCALSKIADEATGQMCANSIGWVLYEPEDYGDRGGLSWRWTTLVWTGEGIAAVCEDCAPTNLYGIAATYAKA